MISGRDAFSQIQTALMGVRREEESLVASLNSATAEAARLRTEEAQSWRALARVRLDALSSEKVSGPLDSSERQALVLIAQRQVKLNEAASQRNVLRKHIEDAAAARNVAAAEVEAAADRIDEQRARTQARLRADPRWKELIANAARLKETAASAAEKAKLSEEEKSGKKKPYEADNLFMYLWSRGYGTAAYKAGSITRFFDGKIARLIDYEELRPNFFMLNEIPTRLRDHAERLARDAEAEAQKLTQLERAELEADGIAPLEAALAQAEAHHQDADVRADALESDLKKREEADRAAPEESTDPLLKRAVDIMAEALSREDLRQLMREALATPTKEDENIVRRIGEVRDAIEAAGRQIDKARQAAVQQAERRKELERTSERFRQRGYDGPFGGFKGNDFIGSLIGGIVGGLLSGVRIDDMLEDAFSRRKPRTRGDFGGGIQLPGGGSWGRGGRMNDGWSGQGKDWGLDDILDKKRRSGSGGGSSWGDIGDWIEDAMKNAGKGGPWPSDDDDRRSKAGRYDDDDSGGFRTGGRF
jgi:hypothetical protein